MDGFDGVSKRAVALRTPHNAVNIIGTGEIFVEVAPKGAHIRIVETDRSCGPSVEVLLANGLIMRGLGGTPDIFTPGKDLEAALFSDWDDLFQDIDVAVIGRLHFFENRVFVVLQVRHGIVAAMEFVGVALHPMIGKGMTRDHAAGRTIAISKRRNEECVDPALLLKDVQHFLCALVEKGNSADLDAYRRFRGEGNAGRRHPGLLPGSGGMSGPAFCRYRTETGFQRQCRGTKRGHKFTTVDV